MRLQALIFIAAVSILQSANAQERHVFPNLSLVRLYNPAAINKTAAFSKVPGTEHVNMNFHHVQDPLQSRTQFPDVQKQLNNYIRFLRIERNQVFQGLFQSGTQGALNKKPDMPLPCFGELL